MYEVIDRETNNIFRFKTREALVNYFTKKTNKNIRYGQIIRDRKSVYNHIIKKLYNHIN